MEYKTVTIAAYDDPNEVWTFHLPDGLGARVQELLLSAVEHAGVDIFTETPATELIIEDGKVVGVVAESEGAPLRVGGKAVVLATGGIPNPGSHREVFLVRAQRLQHEHPHAAAEHGRRPDDGPVRWRRRHQHRHLPHSGGRRPRQGHGLSHRRRWRAAGCHLDQQDRPPLRQRGTAENIGDIGPLYGKQPDGIVWSVLDQANIDRLAENGSEISIGEFVVFGRPLDRLRMELDQDVADGVAFAANTPEELAEKIGVSPENFAATVAAYNEACATGDDKAFFKQEKYLRPLSTPPFYAVALATGTMGSAGGIRINGNMQVVDKDYEPIPGLYAVGLDATGLYGDSYNMEVPGAANGFAHTSGRIAGRHFAAQLA